MALLPWNATAVNQDALTARLFVQNKNTNAVERMLVQTLEAIKEGRLQQALDYVNQLLTISPNFALAHLIHGDLLSAKTRILHGFGDVNAADVTRIQDFKDEAETRIRNYFDRNRGLTQPNLLVELSEKQNHVLFVDTARSRLYVYEKSQRDTLKYVADYYVTIGKNGTGKKDQGDKRTPIGVYFAARKLNRPLPDLYGDAAYPLNYPNEIDSYERKTGSGIWIHGTPRDTYSRPPRASDGCVVLSNPDVQALQNILQTGGTPVVIGVNFQWVGADALKQQAQTKAELSNALESWRRDWVSQNTDAYLSHYTRDFFYSEGDLAKWSSYKRQIQAAKPKVSINLADISMFTYPNAKQNMVVVDFEQEYISPALRNVMKKRQYWVQENGQWKILYEGSA
ncbi:Murein L,D-transpeptidase YafK [Methylophilus rhizosphaerae]|uniref:Murein L,D-transpeptidase YafK n=2 Tax=Methylophilus rhizosphaerae TaxID=492660 RepID=A0A1G9D2K1_9PROT|nr:Murein L,D-transpeptidase YafK [Methylophilus rhizosphaerae]